MFIIVFPSFFMQREEGKSQEMIEILLSFQSVNSFHIQFLHIFLVSVKNKVQCWKSHYVTIYLMGGNFCNNLILRFWRICLNRVT